MPASAKPPAWRRAFLRALSQSDNVTFAAKTARIDHGWVYTYRKRNPVFAKAWARAQARAQARLASDPYAAPQDKTGRPRVLSRAGHGGLKLITPAPDRWNEDKEERFFEALMETGNLKASADHVGVSVQTIFKRRWHWPEFDKAVRETCTIAAEDLNRQLIRAGSSTMAPPKIAHEAETPLVSVDQAIRIVQMNLPELRDKPGSWSRAKAPAAPELTVDEVCARIADTLARLPEEDEADD